MYTKCILGLPSTDNSRTSGVESSSHSGLETLRGRGLGKRNEEKLIQLKLQGEFRSRMQLSELDIGQDMLVNIFTLARIVMGSLMTMNGQGSILHLI